MATTIRVSSSVPSTQRSFLIPDAAQGDQIDIIGILGRPAKNVTFYMTDAADQIDFRLNNLQRLPKFNESAADETVLVWSKGASFPLYSATGATVHTTEDGLDVASLEIQLLTLSSGTTIEIVVS